jgi:hypothetical protein
VDLYTFENGLALSALTLEPAANTVLTFRATSGGDPVETYDLNGFPAVIRTNARGHFSGFKAPVRVGLIDFGDVPLPVSSVEARDAGLYAADAVIAAQEAAQSAAEAAAAADASARAAEAAGGGGPHTHTPGQIETSADVQTFLSAADKQAARAAIGAGTGNGTSDLTLGTSSTTAARGNHTHTATTLTFTPTGTITATNVQDAIAQAAQTGGGSSSGGASGIAWYTYRSGAYPTVPATRPAGIEEVRFRGPEAPTWTALPSWLGTAPNQVLAFYDYAATA